MVNFTEILPTLGRPSLRRTLESIRAQDIRPGDEVLVIADTMDGPQPETKALVEEFGFTYLEYDAGVHAWGAPQRNYGIEQARKGNWLLWIDDTDVFAPGAWAQLRSVITAKQTQPVTVAGWHNAGLIDGSIIEAGRISSHNFIARNMPGKIGQWSTNRYICDWDFIQSTLALTGEPINHGSIVLSDFRVHKILLYCPTYEKDGELQVWPDTLAAIRALEVPAGCVVNVVIANDNPFPGEGHKNTLHQYRQARQIVLSEGYDALLTVEHDMIIPPDALAKLWETPAEVVYGVYLFRHGANVINALQLTSSKVNPGSSLSTMPFEYKKATAQGWYPVSGVGMGCTLIRRGTLERFDFRPNGEGGAQAPDWQVAVDCLRGSIPQVARFDVLCGHIDEDGLILWPSDHGPTVTVECLRTVNTPSGARLKEGASAEIPLAEAKELMRAGYIRFDETAGMPRLSRRKQ